MDKPPCKVTHFSLGRLSGASPSLDQYYVIVMFDISDAKKYRAIAKVLKKYGRRIQKSVFEAHLTKHQISSMTRSLERLMTSERYYCESDCIRIYRIAGNCEAVVFGDYVTSFMEENIVL